MPKVTDTPRIVVTDISGTGASGTGARVLSPVSLPVSLQPNRYCGDGYLLTFPQ